MRYIMKFGGTSVANGGYVRITDILQSFRPEHEVVAVVSAIKGVTDRLLEITKAAERGDEQAVNDFIVWMKELHREEAKRAIGTLPLELDEALSRADRELEHVLYGILHLREATPRSVDYVASFGEKYSALILSAVLNSRGIKSRAFSGGDAGITTDDAYGCLLYTSPSPRD